jgi:hypothetical protein
VVVAQDSLGTVVDCSFNVVVVSTSTRCNFGSYWVAQLQTCVACRSVGTCAAGEYYDTETR